MKPEEIYRLLRDKVKDRAAQIYGVTHKLNTAWTKAVKLTLKEGLTDKHGGRADFTNPEEGTTEFMLDFVWWGQDDRGGVIMGVECEWTTAPMK